MTSRTVSGLTQTLTYDETHRLRGIEVTAGGGDTTSFLYDADGDRVRSTTNGTDTFYVGDYSWTDGGDPEVVYRFGGVLVATRDDTDKVWWSVDDHLSSTSVQYHPGTNTVKDQRFYPYGAVRIDDGVTTDVGYTGQRLDATGLMFYQARYYDPLIGRFTTADTIVPDPANPQDLNRYSYVRNNPLRYTDPSGHWCVLGTNPNGSCRGSDAVAAVGALVTDVPHRVQETAEYVAQRTMERLSNPAQAAFDSVTLTGIVSDAAGLFSTAVLGGEVTTANCPDGAVCVGEADINGFNAQTFGKTILHDDTVMDIELASHEGQHVADIEELGGALMGAAYVFDGLLCGWRGNVFENRGGTTKDETEDLDRRLPPGSVDQDTVRQDRIFPSWFTLWRWFD